VDQAVAEGVPRGDAGGRRGRPRSLVFVGDRLFDDIWGAAAAGMRTIHVPHSDIPVEQVGHTEGKPDEVVEQLAHVYDVVSAWRSGG
jgi:putative hydrolase of the HAD superfamily